MNLLEIEDLHHPDGLHGITISLAAGEILALVGSRGNGRVPLLRLLAGEGRPSRGRIRIAGEPAGAPGTSARVGIAGPDWGFHPLHTVRESLTLYARLWSLPPERADEVADALELKSLGNQMVSGLSPGELARLRLGRALLHNPPLLVLDEPIDDVDGESMAIMEAVISAQAEAGKGVLMTTFGHPRALHLATRVLYMEFGRLVEAPEPPAAPVAAPAPEPPRVDLIAARRDERVVLFAPDEILYAFAQDKNVYIHTREGDWTVPFSLAELEKRLTCHGFFRAHRAYLVNLAQVREITAWTRSSFSLRLRDGGEVPLSKHRVAELKELLGW